MVNGWGGSGDTTDFVLRMFGSMKSVAWGRLTSTLRLPRLKARLRVGQGSRPKEEEEHHGGRKPSITLGRRGLAVGAKWNHGRGLEG